MSPLPARRLARRWTAGRRRLALALFVLFVFVGTAIGFFLTRAPHEYVSETEIVLALGNSPLAPGSLSAPTTRSLAELVHTRTVAANVIAALKLREGSDALLRHIRVEAPQSGILRISVRDSNRLRARRIAAQIDLVYSALVQADFGTRKPVPLRTKVWDAAGEARPVGGHEVLGSLVGALAGAVAGLIAIFLPATRRRREPEAEPAEREDSGEPQATDRERELARREAALEEKSAQLAAARERALYEQAADLDRIEAERATLLAAQEGLERRRSELDARADELASRADALDAREAGLADAVDGDDPAVAPAELAEEPAPLASIGARVAPATAEAPLFVAEGTHPASWRLAELARLVEENADAYPERMEEWRYYLLYLRNFARPDGGLPASFDWLVEEAFGDLVRS